MSKMTVRWSVVVAFACAGCSATVSASQSSGSHPVVDPCAATAVTCRIDGARVVCYAPSAATRLRMFVKRTGQKNELVVLDREGCTFTGAAPTNATMVAVTAYGEGGSVLGMIEFAPPPTATP
jgi:hypothetical protein